MGHTSIEFDISGPFTFHSPFENPIFWFRRLDEFWGVGSGAREREPLPLTIRFRFPVVGWGSVGLCIPGTLRERRGSRMDARARSWRSPRILGSCLAPTRESWRKSRKLVEDRESNDSTVSNPQRRSPLSAYAFRRAQIPADMKWRTRRQGDVGYFGSTPEELDSLQFNMPVAVLDGHDDAKQPHHGPDSQRMIWWRQILRGKTAAAKFF